MDEKIIQNYEDLLQNISVGYNKGITTSAVTMNSLGVLNYAIEVVSGGLESIVSTFEQMQASSKGSANNIEQINSMMGGILNANNALKKDISDRIQEIESTSKDAEVLSASFKDLEEQTKKIAKITGDIQNVVDKTNVLAINASIEAAHAGTFGAGFKIIANEVHSLASQTGNFAKQITESTEAFEKTVEKINTQMNEFTSLILRFNVSLNSVLTNFTNNDNAINTSGQTLSEITAAVREESQALTAGLAALEKVNGSMKDTHTILGAIDSVHRFLDKMFQIKKNV
ncbi:methyl-accepting chemotaxis protein [Treponema parvum]|uniref:methyl-accepting chemotaxis protein n=1 Tax=Treponema parvum TaxID=138851 RepID=UPI001AEC31F5|nr:methyl-accepting chemotaxis protein [Treponema parvum]QTQ15453.1 methyl-accepting chemotaxis protein [Treponema parvum]